MKRLYTSLVVCGGVVGLLFGSYCMVMVKAYARGEATKITVWSVIVVAILGLIGAVLGFVLAAFVGLFQERLREARPNKSAAPNGGTAAPPGSPEVTGGPPSVS